MEQIIDIVSLATLAVLSFAAIILEFACMRAASVPDNEISMIGRRLAIAGWMFFLGRFLFLLVHGGSIYWLSTIGFAALALASIIRCANRLVVTSWKVGDPL